MEPLASVDELNALLQRTVPPGTADMALRMASAKIRAYVRRSIPALDGTATPDDIRAIALAVAGRVVVNPSDIRQEAVGTESITYAAETIGVQLTQDEKHDLDRYRIRYRTLETAWDICTPNQ